MGRNAIRRDLTLTRLRRHASCSDYQQGARIDHGAVACRRDSMPPSGNQQRYAVCADDLAAAAAGSGRKREHHHDYGEQPHSLSLRPRGGERSAIGSGDIPEYWRRRRASPRATARFLRALAPSVLPC